MTYENHGKIYHKDDDKENDDYSNKDKNDLITVVIMKTVTIKMIGRNMTMVTGQY
jgi:hypothetical protein